MDVALAPPLPLPLPRPPPPPPPGAGLAMPTAPAIDATAAESGCDRTDPLSQIPTVDVAFPRFVDVAFMGFPTECNVSYRNFLWISFHRRIPQYIISHRKKSPRFFITLTLDTQCKRSLQHQHQTERFRDGHPVAAATLDDLHVPNMPRMRRTRHVKNAKTVADVGSYVVCVRFCHSLFVIYASL